MIDHLLIHRATIVDVKRTAGTGGAWPEGRATRASNVPCRRNPVGASDDQRALNRGILVSHSIWFHPDQVVELGDEVVIGDKTYTVRRVLDKPSVPIYLKVLAEERIAGA